MSVRTAEMDLEQLSRVREYIVATDEQLAITWASRKFLGLIEDAVGRTAGELFEQLEPGREITASFLSSNVGNRCELFLRGPAARLSLVGQWLPSGSGFVLLADSSSKDDHSVVAGSLLGSGEGCCELMDALSDYIFVLDKNGVIQEVNRVHPGHSVEDVVGKNALSFVPLNYHLEFLDRLRRAIAEDTLQTMETEVILPDGRHNFFNRLKRLSATDDSKVALITTDISQLRRLEKQLQENEEKFRSIFHGVTEGILLADVETRRFTMANVSICRMLGYSPEEIARLDFGDIHPHETSRRREKTFHKMVAGEIELAEDVPLLRKDGSTFFADITVAPISISGKNQLLGCFRDVTERQKLRANLAEADRFASVGTLAAGVAHELNNPLSYVIYDLEILEEDLPKIGAALGRPGPVADRELFGDVQKRFRNILEGVRQIGTIVQGLSTFSRVDRKESSPIEIEEILDLTASMAFNEIKYRARLVKDYGETPLVMASEGRLSQVFLNLLVNAAHAIDEGAVDQNEICVRTWREQRFVCAEIRDSGAGIQPEYLSRIFDPFFTTKEVGEGTGLGLSIAKNIVESFGGTIEVESERGEGTSFVVRLPALVKTEQPPERPSRLVDVKRGRVLVVDDEELICEAIKRMLDPCEVVAAYSGREAQTILEADQQFDVIVCDVMMHDLSGIDLHRWLVEHNSQLAAGMVFVSGGVFTSKAREYFESLDNTRLDKPIKVEEFVRVVMERVETSMEERSR